MSHVVANTVTKTATVTAKAAATPSPKPEPPVLSAADWRYVHKRLNHLKKPERYQLVVVFKELGMTTDKYAQALRVWEEREKDAHDSDMWIVGKPTIPVPDTIQWETSSLVRAVHKGDLAKAHKLISDAEWYYDLGYSPVYYPRKGKHALGGRRNHVISKFVLAKNTDVFAHLLNKMAKLMREKKIPVADHLGLMKIPHICLASTRIIAAYTRYFAVVMGIAA